MVVGELLARVDDAVEVRLHELRDDIHVWGWGGREAVAGQQQPQVSRAEEGGKARTLVDSEGLGRPEVVDRDDVLVLQGRKRGQAERVPVALASRNPVSATLPSPIYRHAPYVEVSHELDLAEDAQRIREVVKGVGDLLDRHLT